MSKPDRIGSIEISQDLEFQARSWRVQRVGWMVMLGLAAGGLLGLFGNGVLASASTGTAEEGVVVKYQRFLRAGGDQQLDFEVTSTAMKADSVMRLWISRDWLSGNQITRIIPQPAGEHVHPDRIVYDFRVGDPASAVTVRFALDAKKFGVRQWRGGVEDGPSLSFRQLAYP